MGIRTYPQMSQISQNKFNYVVLRFKILRHPSELICGEYFFMDQGLSAAGRGPLTAPYRSSDVLNRNSSVRVNIFSLTS